MINKDIKKLSRLELVEIIYQLKKSEEELQAQVEDLQKKLDEKNLKIDNAGSLAEAALSLSDIFSSAQNAADIYLSEIKRIHESAENEFNTIIANAQKKADEIVKEAMDKKEAIHEQCKVSRSELRRVHEVLEALNKELPFEE